MAGFINRLGGAIWRIAMTNVFDTDGSGNANASFRTVATLTKGGNKIRLYFIGPSSGGWKVDNVSIVPRSGTTANGTTTPTEVKFSGGSSGFDLAASATIVSDALNFKTAPGDYLVTQDVSSDTGKAAQAAKLGGTLYYGVSKNWYDQQNVTPDFTYEQDASCFKIEVF